MKNSSSTVSILIAVIILAFSNSVLTQVRTEPKIAGDASDANHRPIVLLELYTSEGCSSCPPADQLLSDIAAAQPYKTVEVVTLAFHIDYWNDGGWRDRFSSNEYTERQVLYAQRFKAGDPFTPQMIFDGAKSVIGNNRKGVSDAIMDAEKGPPKANLTLEIKGETLSVSVDSIPNHGGASVVVAVAESGLATGVKSGENAGRTLEHTSVVRYFRKIGKVGRDESEFKAEIKLPKNSDWKTGRIKYVVFIQENQTMKILGVNQIAR